MTLRDFVTSDGEATAAVLRTAVECTNASDYSAEQIAAWIAGTMDAGAWARTFAGRRALVAVEDGRIVGFGDLDAGAAHLDRLYVLPQYQRRGIASALCDRLEAYVQGAITVDASITAKPFFEKRGYAVETEQQVERKGVRLTNYRMRKAGVRKAPEGIP